MAVVNTGDGRSILLPDDLTEEEIQNQIAGFVSNFPLPTVEEETVETTPTSEEILPEETPPEIDTFDKELEISRNIESVKANRQSALNFGQSSFAYDQKLTELERQLEEVRFGTRSTGDNFGQQIKAGFLTTLEAQSNVLNRENSYENIANLTTQIKTLKRELVELNEKEENEGLDDEEKRRQQNIYTLLQGTGTDNISEMFPGQVLTENVIVAEQKRKLGLIKHRDSLVNNNVSLENAAEKIEVSDAFMHVLKEGQREDPRAISSFINDLTGTEKMLVMRDVLGRSAAATSAILATSFGVAGLTKGMNALYQIGAQILGTGGVSGEIEYSHSFIEYLKTKGLDTSDPNSIEKYMNDEELIDEAQKYAATRGAIIGFIDGVTGGIATRIMAPAVITRSNRSVMKYINPSRLEGQTVSPATKHVINFSAQTPLQTGLPAGAEYFAQLATLEEGERISTGEVFFEALGEMSFVPADMVLGSYSANKEIGFTKAQEAVELKKRKKEQLQISKERSKQEGLGDVAGEIYEGESGLIFDTGVPYFEQANEIYQNNIDDISLYADTDFNVTAPNQFKVKKAVVGLDTNEEGKFVILDTFNKKIGNIFNSEKEAIGVSGALNLISGAFYSKQQKNDAATIQGLNVDAEENPLINKLGNTITNPYFGQLDMVDVTSSPNINFAAYERLTNAIGKDATNIDIFSLQGVLPEADINRLLDVKAKKYYQEANIDKKLPANVTVKMIENLGKKLNLNIDTTSNGFKSLSLKLTGQPNVNKLNNTQKRLVYSFLNTLPQHEGTTVSLPDFSPRPYTINEYNHVVDSLNSGNAPTIPNIVTALGLNPNDINDKRTATRLRQDLVFAGIVDKKGSKYKFNANGEWSLNRAQQVSIENDPQTKTNLQEIQKLRSTVVGLLEQYNLTDLSLKLDKAIQTRIGQSNPDAEGQFDPVWSEIFLNVAKAKEGTTSEQEVLENLSQTLGHELFHAAKFLDLFSNQEINNLNNFVKNNELNKTSAETLLGKDNLKILTDTLGRAPTYLEAIEFRYNILDNQNLNNEELTEEANALLFEDYINNKKKLAGQPRALMERTKKFFSSINNGLNELGFQTYEDVFDKLVSGEIGERERINNSTKPSRIERVDQFGINRGGYEIQTPLIRTNRILENEFSELLRVSETSISNEYFPESADRESPTYKRPLQDAPNLKFKLANTQQRPTTLTQEYWRGAQNGEYGNDINQIGETIFARNIVNNTDIIRRLGRTLENSEIGTTQKQLFEYTQKFLKNAKNYSETFSMYVVGDLNRSTSGTVATNNLEEAENIANEFVNPPFKILGDRKKITEYTVNRPQVMLDKDVMFGAKPPVWAQPSLPSTDYLLIGSSALATSPNQPVSYQERTPPKGVVTRKFNLGTLKPKYSLKGMEFLSPKGTRGKQITDNLRTYRNSIDLIGQASLQEKKLNKKLKLSAKENERVIYIPGTFQPKIIKEVGDFKIVKDDYLEGNLNVGKILDVDVELFRDPGGFAGENYSMVITDSRAIGDANVGLYANNLKQAKLEAVNEIEKFATNSVLEDVTGRRLYQTNNKRLYFFEDDPIVINHLEEETFGVKQKLSEPLDDIAFKNAKEDLLELMNQGVDVIELADHPALIEGMSRMAEIQPTSDQYLNKFGEDWFLNKAYINNRKFIINNKSVIGMRKAVNESIKKAESYSNIPVPNNKQAWIVLGATASGKSYYSEILAKENNLAIVDSDDVKKIIPEYKGGVGANAVHTESRNITSLVRTKLMKEGKNMLLPRVGGLPKRKEIQSLIQELKESGYNVKTVFIDTDYRTALGRMYERFAKTGRLVPPSYIEGVKNTPIDTFHRVKYNTDGYAWIDNNGEQNQETIRQDTGILPTDVFGGRGNDVGRILRESSEENVRNAVSEEEEEVTIQEAIEGVKSINDRLVSAGFFPKFNLDASPDAIRAAYIAELNKNDLNVIPDNLRPKYSIKSTKSTFTQEELDLINKTTIREQYIANDKSFAAALLEAANGFLTQDNILILRENLVDQHARFAEVEKAAFKRRGQTEAEITADISMTSALYFQERSAEVFKAVFMEGFAVYDEKGRVRAETVSPITGKPAVSLFKAFTPAFKNQDLMWAWQTIRISNREKRFDNEGKPVITSAVDRKRAEQFYKDHKELFDKMSEAYDEFDKHMVKLLVDTGVLDATTAEKWLEHSDYFPFYRQIGVDENGKQLVKGPKVFQNVGTGKNIFISSKGSSDTKVTDPMTAITQNIRAAITLSMKNVAANRVVRDMVDAGFAMQVPVNRAKNNANVITIRVEGKTKAFEIAEEYPQLFEAFQNFENGSFIFGSITKAASIPKKVLSGLITRFPSFWIRQVERDAISAQALFGGWFPPLWTSLSNWAKTWAGMTAAKLPFNISDDVFAKGFSTLKQSGIISGYDTVAGDIDDTNKLIKQLYKKNNVIRKGYKGLWDAGIFPFMKLWEISGEGTITSDAGTRLAVYDAILKKTGNESEAVYQAMQVLDFTRRGKAKSMQFFSMVIPFLNPRLQGVDVFSRALTGSYGQSGLTRKQRQRNTIFRLGGLMSLAPLYYFSVKDSDEYKEATDYQRDNYLIVPGSKKLFGETFVLSKPFEVGLFAFTIPERILRWASGDETFERTAMKIFENTATTLAIDPRQITAINPILEVATNYDFYTGEPIVSHNLKKLDPALQYRPSTNNLFIEVGQELGVSPLYVENLWSGYTGTMGAYFAAVADSATRDYFGKSDRPAMEMSDKPLTSAFFMPKEGRGLEEVFYNFKGELNNLFLSMQENERRKLEMGDKTAEKISPEYSIQYMDILKTKIDELNLISETLSNFKLEEDRIRNTDLLNAEQKLERINLQKQKTNLLLKDINIDRMNWEKGILEEIESP